MRVAQTIGRAAELLREALYTVIPLLTGKSLPLARNTGERVEIHSDIRQLKA